MFKELASLARDRAVLFTVIAVHHLHQQLPVVGFARNRRRQLVHGAMFDRLGRRGCCGKMVCSQKLDGVAEADALGLHHPVDGRAACIARAQAVPEVLRRSGDRATGCGRRGRGICRSVPAPNAVNLSKLVDCNG